MLNCCTKKGELKVGINFFIQISRKSFLKRYNIPKIPMTAIILQITCVEILADSLQFRTNCDIYRFSYYLFEIISLLIFLQTLPSNY